MMVDKRVSIYARSNFIGKYSVIWIGYNCIAIYLFSSSPIGYLIAGVLIFLVGFYWMRSDFKGMKYIEFLRVVKSGLWLVDFFLMFLVIYLVFPFIFIKLMILLYMTYQMNDVYERFIVKDLVD